MNLVWVLAKNFLLLSLIAFGGVSAALPEMHRVLIDTLHLMSEKDFTAIFALSQAAPGPNLMFVALFGSQVAGTAGASVSLLAMCGPTTLLAIGVEHFGARHHESSWYVKTRRALTPITIGLLLSTGYILMRQILNPATILLTAATLLATLKYKLNPLWLIAAGAALGGAGLV